MNSKLVDTASTNGWDTVFAMHIGDINRAIAKANSSPNRFDVADPQDGISAVGDFGTWQIITGGDAELVRLGIPVSEVTIKGLPGGEITVASALLKADVRLGFLHDAEVSGRGDLHHLKVRTSLVPGETNIVTMAEVIFPDPQPSFMAQAAMQALSQAWLNANIGDFDHVFATIDLNHKADKAEFHWLKPTDHAYAYSDLGTKEDGALAILCMTQNRSPDRLIPQLSSVAIPPSQRAGFLISKERLIEQMLLPVMPMMFAGTTAADFSLSASGDSIVNAHDRITFTLKDTDGKEQTAQLVSLSLRIEGSELQMDVETKTNVAEGIRAFCRAQNCMKISLVNKPDGRQTLGFRDSSPGSIEHWTEEDSGYALAEEILAGVAILAMLVLAFATAGTTLAATALVIGVVAGAAGGALLITETAIKMAGKDDAPAIDAVVLDATAPIVWRDSGDFKLGFAQLSDSLQLGGEALFA